MKDISLRILDMECAACVARLDRAQEKLPGVQRAAVNYTAASALITYDERVTDLAAIAARVKRAGFRVPVEEQDLLPAEADAARTAAAADALRAVFGVKGMAVQADGTLTAYLWPIGVDGRDLAAACAWRGLRNRTFGMDFLVSLSSTLIYLYSAYVTFTPRRSYKLYFASDGVLLSLILFGKYMEQVAAGEANSAIRKLMHLQPRTAMVQRGDTFVELPVDQIAEHDRVRIRPGERVPVDGTIISGQCAVDESMLTGESMPVDKAPGDKVIGGSLNRSGSAIVSAEALGKASVLEQIIQIVRQAQCEKAPVQRFADKVARWFVPGVIGAAALTFLVWYRRIAPRNLERALLTCCDVLSVACPCALGRGVRGTVAGAAVVCGSRTWLHELGIDTAALAALPDLHAQAKTELCVTRCGPTRRPPPSSACARRGKRSAWSATASTTRRRSPWRTARSPWAAGRTSPSSRRASCCRPAIWKSCRSCLTFPARPSAPSART